MVGVKVGGSFAVKCILALSRPSICAGLRPIWKCTEQQRKGVTKVLNHKEAAVMTRLVAHLNGTNTLSGAALQQLISDSYAVVQASLDARAGMSESARARTDKRGRGESIAGRPPSTHYVVELGSAWEATVSGAKAAHEMIVETIKQHEPRMAVPSLGSVQVQLSRTGEWWRLLDTDFGQQTLSVRKCAAPKEPEPEPEAPEPAEQPSRKRAKSR